MIIYYKSERSVFGLGSETQESVKHCEACESKIIAFRYFKRDTCVFSADMSDVYVCACGGG